MGALTYQRLNSHSRLIWLRWGYEHKRCQNGPLWITWESSAKRATYWSRGTESHGEGGLRRVSPLCVVIVCLGDNTIVAKLWVGFHVRLPSHGLRWCGNACACYRGSDFGEGRIGSKRNVLWYGNMNSHKRYTFYAPSLKLLWGGGDTVALWKKLFL